LIPFSAKGVILLLMELRLESKYVAVAMMLGRML